MPPIMWVGTKQNLSYFSYIDPNNVLKLILFQVKFNKYVSAVPIAFVVPAVKSAVRKTNVAVSALNI